MMKPNKIVSSEHVTLLPNDQKVTLGNLIKDFLYYHDDIGKSDLLNHNIPQEHENKYIHRGFIFLSLLILILLDRVAQPLKKLGFKFERFLNRKLIPRNGEAEIDENSDGFISLVGHLDSRMELDKDIKQGDGRYYPALSMMAAKLAYENASVVRNTVSRIWNMEYVDFYDCYNEFLKQNTTQAFMMQERNAENDTITVAFRGTSMFEANDWSTDFDISWLKIEGMGKIHKGFMMALGLKKCFHEDSDNLGDFYGDWPKQIEHDHEYPLAYYTIKEKLRELISENKRAKIIFTGHSLGGALAILFPAILALHGEVEILDRLEAIYTYGQPRVGNELFGEFMKNKFKEHNIKYYRIVYGYDIVPEVPFDNTLMTFKHFGTCIHFNSLYQAKIVEEKQIKEEDKEGQKKGFRKVVIAIIKGLKELTVARVIAVWQLIRGFIIGYIAGPDFREGWLLICARFIGILIPSFIDHNPQDYVNSTRLASEELFKNYSHSLSYNK
ncbi:triacylglycerol lipase OBL1-like [Silene latifolia]|uniref:triacylglycerol lipase OBL1-like n=1 Tax=Silene latifolia TaxID=37657 RepID=UPI003D7753B7